MGDGIFLAKIFEQRCERREPVADRAAAKPAPRQLFAPLCARVTVRNSSGRVMPVKCMKSRIAFS
jgi:hypothetical protein